MIHRGEVAALLEALDDTPFGVGADHFGHGVVTRCRKVIHRMTPKEFNPDVRRGHGPTGRRAPISGANLVAPTRWPGMTRDSRHRFERSESSGLRYLRDGQCRAVRRVA